MAILGYDTLGVNSLPAVIGRKLASKFTLATPQTLTELHAWARGTSQSYVIHIHADSAGSPGARLAYTSPIAVNSGLSTMVEISQTGLSTSLVAGDYWLGVTFQTASGDVASLSAVGVSKGFLAGATFSPPSDPFGTTDYSGADKLSVWAVVGASGGAGGGAILERKAGAASVDCDDYNALVDAVVALGGSVATRKAGSGAVNTADYNAVVTAVVALGGSVATRKAGSGQVNTADYNAVVDAVKLLGAP